MTEKRKIKPASIKNHLRHREERTKEGKLYAEEEPDKLGAAIESTGDVESKLADVDSMDSEGRANLGGLVGAHLGNKMGGAQGALVGAAIGSDATRSFAMARSGEQEMSQRQNKVLEALQTSKVIDKNQKIKFKDGGELDVSDPVSEILPNTAPNIAGKKARSVFEADETNPFTSRAKAVVKPIAYYVVGGLLQQDLKDPAVLKTVDTVASMFTNAFQTGVKSMASVYGRATEVAKKLGASEKQMGQFFYDQRELFSEDDAKDIKQGLTILFRK